MTPTFVEPAVEWFYLVPLIVVLGVGVLGVLVEAFVPDRVRRDVQLWLSLAALAGGLVAVVLQWDDINDTIANQSVVQVLGSALVLTPTTLLIQGAILVIAALALVVVADRSSGNDAFAPTAAAIPGSDYEEIARRRGLVQTEVFPLFLFSVGGMLLFPAAGNLLTMFIALEVLSFPLYVMSGMARHRRLLSQEASLKYFLLGAFSSAIFLFGMALVYGYAGTLELRFIANAIINDTGMEGMAAVLITGVVLMLVGLLFKVGAVPFHQWTPDVYAGAPTPITGFMAACTKIAAFGAVLRVVFWIVAFFNIRRPDIFEAFSVGMWTIAIATMVLGSVVAVVQHDVKRVLAYSSIAHAGFILVGITAMSTQAIPATIFYLGAYGLATVGAFAIVHLVRETSTAHGDSPVILGEATHLSQWAGLGRRSPWLAGAFTLFLLSFAGIPLTAGFIGKFTVFSTSVAAGDWPLALIGVLASAVAVFFYVRIVVLMYFVAPTGDEPETAATASAPDETDGVTSDVAPAGEPDRWDTPEAGVGLRIASAPVRAAAGVQVLRGGAGIRIVVALCALGTLALGVFPGPVLDLVAEATKFIP